MLILLSFYQGGTMFYDNFKAACERKGTTITAVLADIGRASGNTGGWNSHDWTLLWKLQNIFKSALMNWFMG